MSTRSQVLWSLFIVWHLLMMGVSMGRDTAVGEALRVVTKPYEQLFGLHQTWTMFAPDPPRGTTWLEAEGIHPDGQRVRLPVAAEPPDPSGPILGYDRGGKFSRNVGGTHRGKLRTGYVRGLCRAAASEGVTLRGVRLIRHIRQTPVPSGRATVPDREDWPVKTHRFRERPCR